MNRGNVIFIKRQSIKLQSSLLCNMEQVLLNGEKIIAGNGSQDKKIVDNV